MGFVSDALGKGGGGDAPQAPDYTRAAIATANANKYNTAGPYGSGTWAIRPGADPNNPQAGDWAQTTTLNPQEQGLYDQNVQNRGGVASATGSMLGDLGDRQTIADALYRKATQYMGQEFGDQERALETKLQNQGLAMGSEAYDNAMRNFQQTRGQAYEGAATNATINADTAQNNAVQRIAQMLQMGRENAPQTAGVGGGADLLGAQQAQYNANMDAYNAKEAGKDAGMGQAMGLGSMALKAFSVGGFSDRRLKSNIQHVGSKNGLNVYEYDIFGRRERGYMADEVESAHPSAVSLHSSGYKMVDYAALGGRP